MNRLRPRFSLLTLLLLLTILILGFSHLVTSCELSSTRRELLEFRYQYGVLVVDDATRPHVLRYANLENPWKWHINLPVDQPYKLTCGVGSVPRSGVPNAADLRNVQETWLTGDGETRTIFVSLLEADADTWKLSIGGDGSQTISQLIAKDEVFKSSIFDVSAVGFREPYVGEADSPFVIFSKTDRNTAAATGPNATAPNATAPNATAPNATANGVVVWLVPVDEGI